jgi:NTE family protein
MNQTISLHQWLSTEPFCLSMGAGYFGFFSHCGFISALECAGLKPLFISGASSGALIGSMWASGMSAEAIQQQILSISKNEFWDPGLGLGLLKGQLFKKLLQKIYPVSHVEQCTIPLSVSAFSPLNWKTKAIQTGEIAKAVYASCAIPGLFQPQWLRCLPHWDGGIRDREALAVYAHKNRNRLNVSGKYNQLADREVDLTKDVRILHHRIPTRSTSLIPTSSACVIKNIKTIQLQNIPRSGPDLLHLGEEIIQLSKIQMQSLLDKPI